MADDENALRHLEGSERASAVVCWLAASADDPEPAGLRDSGGPVAIGRHSDGPEMLAAGGEDVFVLPPGATLAHLANLAAERWPDRDLALVVAAEALPARWVERLRAAVATESTAATASAVVDQRPSAASDAAEAEPSPLPPRLAAATPSCLYVDRGARELIGPFDETLQSGYAAALDFTLRARRRGLANLLADDVLVRAPAVKLDPRDERTLRERHPAAMMAVAAPPAPAVERSLLLASVVGEPLSVTFDARALGPGVGGTQVYLLNLLEALATRSEIALRVLVGPGLPGETQRRLEALEGGVGLLSYEQALERPEPLMSSTAHSRSSRGTISCSSARSAGAWSSPTRI